MMVKAVTIKGVKIVNGITVKCTCYKLKKKNYLFIYLYLIMINI